MNGLGRMRSVVMKLISATSAVDTETICSCARQGK
jgi:hypothetical protein